MFPTTGSPTLSSEWTYWQLLFARQPEPDLEFSEEDLDEAVPPPPPLMNAPKRSGNRPLLWILLILVLGGVGYVAMDPDGAMQLIEPYLDTDTGTTQPAAGTASNPEPTPKIAPPELIERGSSRVPDQEPQPPSVANPAASAVKPPPAFVNVTSPQFSEGQRVTVIPNQTRTNAPVPLFIDAAGTKTSTTVPASATLTILDGDYQTTGWVYSVRTEDGRKGWIPERGLRLKR